MGQIVIKASTVLVALVVGLSMLFMLRVKANAGCSQVAAANGWCTIGVPGGGSCWKTSTNTTVCE